MIEQQAAPGLSKIDYRKSVILYDASSGKKIEYSCIDNIFLSAGKNLKKDPTRLIFKAGWHPDCVAGQLKISPNF